MLLKVGAYSKNQIVNYSNDTLRCVTAKAVGAAFSISHWTPASNATTAYIKNLGDSILLTVGTNDTEAKRLISVAQKAADAAGVTADAAKATGETLIKRFASVSFVPTVSRILSPRFFM